MTLRNSFFREMKEDQKRRTWTIVVFALLCFMMTASFELRLESYLDFPASGRLQSNIYELTESGMLFLYLMAAVVGAMLYGFHGFGWLAKKQQVDFYHSQPMRRKRRFAIQYLNGLLFFEIPMLLHLLISVFFIGIRGCLDSMVIMNLAMNLLVFTLTFLLSYSLIIVSVMLTGNLTVSYMAAGVLFFYPYVVRLLAGVYYETYFDTFVQKFAMPMAILSRLSPCERIYEMASLVSATDKTGLPASMLYVAAMAVFFLGAAFYLYKKRPSECAGKALAFPVFGDIIRFLIVIPGALSFGMLFAAWNGRNGIFWLYFGTVVGVIITHGFMEVVFQFDIRAALKKKVQLLCGIVLMVAVVSVFRFDLMGYDKYLPEVQEVKSVSYYINVGEYMDYYYLLDENGVPLGVEEDWQRDHHVSRQDYQLEVSKTDDPAPVLDMIKGHLKKDDTQLSTSRIYFMVQYELENGRTEYRKYHMDTEYVKTAFRDIYESEEGKKILYPYRNLSGKQVESVSVYSPIMAADASIALTAGEIEELAECYRKDLADREMDRLFEDRILGRLTFHYVGKGGGTAGIDLYVSEADVRMNEFLEKHQVSLKIPNENYVVESAVVYNPYDITSTKDHPFWRGSSEVQLDVSQMEELFPLMVPDHFMMGGYEDLMFYCTLMIRNNTTGQIREVYYYLNSSDAPDYMLMQ